MARSVLAGTLVSPPSNPSNYAVFGKPIERPTPPVSFGEMYQNSNGQQILKEQPSIAVNSTVDFCTNQPSPARLKKTLVEDFHGNLTEMVAGAEAALSVTDEKPSRVLRLDRLVPTGELYNIYKMAFLLPCSHQICKKSDCYYFPVIKDEAQTVLEFSSETKAAIFKRFLANRMINSQFVPSTKSQQTISNTSMVVTEEFRKGIPRRTQLESYCVCTVNLHCISSSSVENGSVSAPVKISIFTGKVNTQQPF